MLEFLVITSRHTFFTVFLFVLNPHTHNSSSIVDGNSKAAAVLAFIADHNDSSNHVPPKTAILQ